MYKDIHILQYCSVNIIIEELDTKCDQMWLYCPMKAEMSPNSDPGWVKNVQGFYTVSLPFQTCKKINCHFSKSLISMVSLIIPLDERWKMGQLKATVTELCIRAQLTRDAPIRSMKKLWIEYLHQISDTNPIPIFAYNTLQWQLSAT